MHYLIQAPSVTNLSRDYCIFKYTCASCLKINTHHDVKIQPLPIVTKNIIEKGAGKL